LWSAFRGQGHFIAISLTIGSSTIGKVMSRGLNLEHGVLVVIDGGKGLRAAVGKGLGKRALVQRCQWHKRENVVSHLPVAEQASMRKRLKRAYERPTYSEAHEALTQIRNELEGTNQSAMASLDEGVEETLTLHRLGVFAVTPVGT
jgi:transposase-like protein